MLELDQAGLKDTKMWEAAGIRLPGYDVAALCEASTRPGWLHIGAGNIFRALPAAIMQRLIAKGLWHGGIAVAECFDGEIISRAYRPYDNLSLLCALGGDGTVDMSVIGSVTESLRCDGQSDADTARFYEILADEKLQMVSLTITEKGYAVVDGRGAALPDVDRDLTSPLKNARTAMAMLTAGLYGRFLAGGAPIALVSMDNCSRNGDKLRAAVLYFAEGWRERGFVGKEFLRYLMNPAAVSYPLSMVDKITPRPDARIAEMLRARGFMDDQVFRTERGAYTSAFVNAEKPEYLVIEDNFPAGRPPLEKAGVLFAGRDTVIKSERMKVCTCLNPLHTALAVCGCLLGFTFINSEMQDDDLCALVTKLAYDEMMPVVTDPGIISPAAFANEVLTERFPNPFLPDTPQRIASDTSQKIPIRFGETLKAYAASDTLDQKALKLIPFVLAAWLRYTVGYDDDFNEMPVSPDPMLAEIVEALGFSGIGKPADEARLTGLLSRADIFGVDLRAIHLAPLVTQYLNRMLVSRGAVREILHELVS